MARPLDASETLALWQQNWAAQTPDIDVYIIDVIWPGIAAPHADDLKQYFTPEEVGAFFPRMIENNTVKDSLRFPFLRTQFCSIIEQIYWRSTASRIRQTPGASSRKWRKKIQDGEVESGVKDFYGFLFQGAAYEGLTCNGLEWLSSNGGGHIVEPDGKVSINNP